ncbi:CDGSH iron-sulfur domain-containing protein [Modestobacter sp. NPDC049651]|uniref:CDGSH iron-sulfur domain-containing protein n=1 Tax=unclassified Modestobacter TaxID=2643866 RepID=UPI0033C4EEA2
MPDETLAEQPATDTADLSDAAVRGEPPADDPLATITPYVDGPLIVRGTFRLVDTDGQEIDPGRRTVALCRCGKSAIKPFCDGSHKRAGFHAGSAPTRPRPAAELFRSADEG